jgi:hypothetical protein
MLDRIDIELRINKGASVVLEQIVAATEREILPFVSASRYPMQTEKTFVGKVSGSRFRIWKVPSASRSRQNICHPYLRGEVKDSGAGSILSGSFSLHPFDIVVAVIPLATVVTVLFGSQRIGAAVIGFALFFLIIDLIIITGIRRIRPREEQDIVQFLVALFPEAERESTVEIRNVIR